LTESLSKSNKKTDTLLRKAAEYQFFILKFATINNYKNNPI